MVNNKFKPNQIVKVMDQIWLGEIARVKNYEQGGYYQVEIVSTGDTHFVFHEDLVLQHGVCVEQLTTRKGAN